MDTRSFRRRHGYTQRELAELWSAVRGHRLDPRQVSAWETGSKRPSSQTIAEWARLLEWHARLRAGAL